MKVGMQFSPIPPPQKKKVTAVVLPLKRLLSDGKTMVR